MFCQSLFTVDALSVSSKLNPKASTSNMPRFASYQTNLSAANISTIEKVGPVNFGTVLPYGGKIAFPDERNNQPTSGKICYDGVLEAFKIKDRQSTLEIAQSNIVTFSNPDD